MDGLGHCGFLQEVVFEPSEGLDNFLLNYDWDSSKVLVTHSEISEPRHEIILIPVQRDLRWYVPFLKRERSRNRLSYL